MRMERQCPLPWTWGKHPDIQAAGGYHGGRKEYRFVGINVGNPHAIYYVDQVDCLDLERIGPAFENHERFAPDRVNTEFIHVVDRKHPLRCGYGSGEAGNLGLRHRRHGQRHGLHPHGIYGG